jgi:hypothetical protein
MVTISMASTEEARNAVNRTAPIPVMAECPLCSAQR